MLATWAELPWLAHSTSYLQPTHPTLYALRGPRSSLRCRCLHMGPGSRRPSSPLATHVSSGRRCNQGRSWASGHLGCGPGRSSKIILYIGLFSIKKSSLKYIIAKKCDPKDLLAPIEFGTGGLPPSLKSREYRLFQLFRKLVWLRFLYCQRPGRLHSVFYRSPRLQALRIWQEHKATTPRRPGGL
jgi:hypothetical protein